MIVWELALAAALVAAIPFFVLWVWTLAQHRRHQGSWELIAQGCPDILWHWDQRRQRFTVSERAWEWLGLPRGDSQRLFERRREFIHPDDFKMVSNRAQEFREGTLPILDLEFRVRLPGRDDRWVRARGVPENGMQGNIAGSLSDVTEVRALGDRLWKWAHFDPLTNLANRLRILEVLQSFPQPFCLLLVDVDHFSAVNDAYQHSGGDRLLQKLAGLLDSLFRADDLVGRWGGDEFVVAVRGDVLLAKTLAGRIHQTLASGVPVGSEGSWKVSASIGIVPYPEGTLDGPALITQAEQALHKAQRSGGGRSVVFDQSIGAEADRRVRLERNLVRALDEGRLRLVFQPQFRLEDHSLTGFEALARWDDPELGPVPPDEFIPIAEHLGLMRPLGSWALAEAGAFLHGLPGAARQQMTVSVNVSVQQIRDENFVEVVRGIVEASNLEPSSFELEITESILVQNFDDTVAKLAELRALGFRIALDDFGKGYSSLSYLKLMPLDTLKIDKDFVADSAQESLLGAIVGLGILLGLQVVAEGVEESQQLIPLVTHGCHKVQGFFFSRPLEATAARALVGSFV